MKLFRFLSMSILLTFAASFVGCGGGGETSSVASDSELEQYLQENPEATEETEYVE